MVDLVIDGKPVTGDEVEKALGARLQKLPEQVYSTKRQKLRAMIGERLLAATPRSGESPSITCRLHASRTTARYRTLPPSGCT